MIEVSWVLKKHLVGVFATASLAVVICLAVSSEAKAWRYLTVSDVPSTALWGPTVNGLRISLSLDRTNFRVGDAVTATLYLENLGPDRNLGLDCFEWGRYGFCIVDTQGGSIARKPVTRTIDCYTNPSSWPPKHDDVIESTLILNEKYDIAPAGADPV
jgi:hypothetical protein